MSDPLSPFPPGRVSPLVTSAATGNAILEAARWYRDHKDGPPSGGLLDDLFEAATQCLVKWTGGSALTLAPFSVLAYGTPVVSPATDTANRLSVARRPAFEAAAPTDPAAPFVVTRRPIKGQGFGLAATSGLVPVQIDVADPAHTRAVPVAGITDYLRTAAAGGVPVVWKESAGSGSGSGSGSSPVWAVVLLGGADPGCCGTSPPPPPGATLPLLCPVGSGSGGSGSKCWLMIFGSTDPDEAGTFCTDDCTFDPVVSDNCSAGTGWSCTEVSKLSTWYAGMTGAGSSPTSLFVSYCDGLGGAWTSCFGGHAQPSAACVTASGGTRAYSGVGSVSAAGGNTDGSGWPVEISAGGVTISGRLAPCPGRCGLFFSGTITSTNADPDNSPLYDCGCFVRIDPCAPDGGGVSQALVTSDYSVPTQTLRITTGCGTIDLTFAACPTPATYNCVAGVCVDPGDGTGTYDSLAACVAGGCAAPSVCGLDGETATLVVASGPAAGTYTATWINAGGIHEVVFNVAGGEQVALFYSETDIACGGSVVTAGQYYMTVGGGAACGPIVDYYGGSLTADCGPPATFTGGDSNGALGGSAWTVTT